MSKLKIMLSILLSRIGITEIFEMVSWVEKEESNWCEYLLWEESEESNYPSMLEERYCRKRKEKK